MTPTEKEAQDRLIMRLGGRAGELLDTPEVAELFGLVKGDLLNSWSNTQPADAALREALYHDVRALHALQAKLAELRARRDNLVKSQELQRDMAEARQRRNY